VCVEENGEVWSWGRKQNEIVSEEPQKITEMLGHQKIVKISAGSEHNAALNGLFASLFNKLLIFQFFISDNGKVFTWGNGNYGQTGLG
jgi:alpha-tubulin suppressor-like RCC1 family protein